MLFNSWFRHDPARCHVTAGPPGDLPLEQPERDEEASVPPAQELLPGPRGALPAPDLHLRAEPHPAADLGVQGQDAQGSGLSGHEEQDRQGRRETRPPGR